MTSSLALRYSQGGVLAAAVIVLASFAVALRTVRSSAQASASVLHTQEVRLKLGETLAQLKEISATTRTYLVASDDRALTARQQNLAEFEHGLTTLRALTAGDATEQAALRRLAALVQKLMALYDSYAELRRTSGLAAVTARAGDGELKRLGDDIRSVVTVMQHRENRRLEDLMATVRDQAQTTRRVLEGGLALAVLLVVAVVLLLRREFRIRAAAAQAVAAARGYAESIVHTVREPLVILTPDLRVDSANRRFHELGGTTPEAIAGRPLVELNGGGWASTALQEALATILPQREELKDFKVAADFPAVGPRVMLLNARRLARGGEGPALVLLAMEDITEREQMQSALEHERDLLGQLMDNLTECIYFKDAAGRFIRINRGLARRFGLDDPAAAIGKTDFDFYTAEHAQPAFDDEQQVMRTAAPLLREEKETWPDGHITWALTVKLPLRDAAKKIVGTYGLSRDITDRKNAELKLQELNAALDARGAELEIANRELEAFSYSVSHDLRAPLRHIDYFASALEKNLAPAQLDAKARRHLSTISKSARSMGQLIDDLLSFARISRVELRRTRVRLDEIVAETRQALQGEINGRTVAWQVDPLPEVEGDPALLRQVFANLLSNAVKYTRQRATAAIEIAPEKITGDEVVVRVRDNGAGFDMKYADKLFGVFQRLHANTEFEGTGVGLANVRRIIERHGGRIWAQAEVDRGATFYLSLHAARAAN